MTKTSHSPQAGHRYRLRKKFTTTGLDSFLDHEVLELLLTYSIPRKDTKPVAWKLLRSFGSLANVLDASPAELSQIEGVGPQTAAFIPLMRALLKRYALSEIQSRPCGSTPEAVMNYCRASLSNKKEEFLEILFLSSRHTILGSKIISTGHRDKIDIAPRDIIGEAFAAKAEHIILVHNHPSGDPEPSEDDIAFTHKLLEVAEYMGLKVSDHIIVGKGQVYSFRAHQIY